MIDSRMPPLAADGLTGGAVWRRQALRVVRTAPTIVATSPILAAGIMAAAPATLAAARAAVAAASPRSAPSAARAHEPQHPRIRASRTFAQHGVLGSPHSLIVRVAVEHGSAGLAAGTGIDVTFDVPTECFAFECESAAGWYEPAAAWSFTVTTLGDRATIGLSYHGMLAAGELAEATFHIALADDADLSQGLVLRASGRSKSAPDGPRPSDVTVPVERLRD